MSTYQYTTAAVAMTTQHDGASGSPNSSEEVESHHGTPETKFSIPSPEDLKTEQMAAAFGATRIDLPPAFTLNPVHARSSSKGKAVKGVKGDSPTLFTIQDPFTTALFSNLTTRSFNELPKLSPIASTFTPSGSQGFALSDIASRALSLPLMTPDPKNGMSDMNCLEAPSVPTIKSRNAEITSYRLVLPSTATVSPSSQAFASTLDSPSLDLGAINFGQFSSEGNTSRSLMISQVARKTSAKEVDDFFDNFCTLKNVVLTELAVTGTMYVSFADIRDAHKAYTKALNVHGNWRLKYIAAAQVATTGPPESLTCPLTTAFEGQITVWADCSGQRQRFSTASIGPLVRELLQNYGDLMAYDVGIAKPGIVTCRAEYYDITAAEIALAQLNGFQLGGCTLVVTRFIQELECTPRSLNKSRGPLIIGQEHSSLNEAFENMHFSDCQDVYDNGIFRSIPNSPYAHSEEAGRSIAYGRDLEGQKLPSPLDECPPNFAVRNSASKPQWSPTYTQFLDYGPQSPIWPAYSPSAYSSGSYSSSLYSPGAIGQERGAPLLSQHRPGYYPQQQRGIGKLGGRPTHDYASGHHNVVDVERIRQGTDVRTTIMLRNIPNKIDQAMLKDIIDETSLGKYDFMYLRIDFANNCNVGYAFINFEDPYFIIDFVNSRAGHRWNRYNSDKVAEVSYATIQGRDCLVQKFRNSSVMLEHPSFRPKIFHTGSGALSGTEDQFPGPDNPSKMRRSVENAEHVGLFAPRAGQNFRDEQRRRRSQYDRGTRLAEIEDAYDIDRQEYRNAGNSFYPEGKLA